MSMWFDRRVVTLPGTFKGSEVIAAVEVVTTEAQYGYHLQQRPDGTFDVGQESGLSWENFSVGGPTDSIYDELSIDPGADYDRLTIDNEPWSEGGLEGGAPVGDEMELFVKALLKQLAK